MNFFRMLRVSANFTFIPEDLVGFVYQQPKSLCQREVKADFTKGKLLWPASEQ